MRRTAAGGETIPIEVDQDAGGAAISRPVVCQQLEQAGEALTTVTVGNAFSHQRPHLAHPHRIHAEGRPVIDEVAHQRGLHRQRPQIRRVLAVADGFSDCRQQRRIVRPRPRRSRGHRAPPGGRPRPPARLSPSPRHRPRPAARSCSPFGSRPSWDGRSPGRPGRSRIPSPRDRARSRGSMRRRISFQCSWKRTVGPRAELRSRGFVSRVKKSAVILPPSLSDFDAILSFLGCPPALRCSTRRMGLGGVRETGISAGHRPAGQSVAGVRATRVMVRSLTWPPTARCCPVTAVRVSSAPERRGCRDTCGGREPSPATTSTHTGYGSRTTSPARYR